MYSVYLMGQFVIANIRHLLLYVHFGTEGRGRSAFDMLVTSGPTKSAQSISYLLWADVLKRGTMELREGF